MALFIERRNPRFDPQKKIRAGQTPLPCPRLVMWSFKVAAYLLLGRFAEKNSSLTASSLTRRSLIR